MKKIAVVNLGCPKNQVDSEVITGMLARDYLITNDPSEANIIIVNTCGFIEEAKDESIETIYEMTQLKTTANCEKIIAVGCLAQRYGKELLEEIPELDGVLGDGDLTRIPKELESIGNNRLFTNKKVQDFIYSHDMPRMRLEPKYTAYVKIAEGCDNCCSYCAIPMIKGRYRSRTISSIIEETRKLALEGVKEIILVAQDTTRYGIDRGKISELPSLLRELVKIEGIEWIRMLYCYPEAITDELIDIMANEPKICKYVDLPLQHADDKILEKMNRRNTAEDAAKLINKLRNKIPGVFIRSTFITGFPGETDQQFQNLLKFVQHVQLDRVGVFAYSQEENTPAGKMEDQIPREIREDRKNKLMALQAEIAYLRQQEKVGKTLRVLLEEEISDRNWLGRTEGDAPEIDGQIEVSVNKEHRPGDIIKVRIGQADSYDMRGEEQK